MSKKPKAKPKPVKGNVAEQIVLNFVQGENKPLSVSNLVDCLASKGLTRTNAVRAVEALVTREQIMVKEYGKTKIYLAQQRGLKADTPEEAKEATERIKAKTITAAQDKAESERLASTLRSLNAEPTDTELAERLRAINESNARAQEKLTMLSSNATVVDKKQVAAAEKKFTSTLAVWKKRKRTCNEIAGQISEGGGMKASKIYETAGCETDEEIGMLPRQVEDALSAKRQK